MRNHAIGGNRYEQSAFCIHETVGDVDVVIWEFNMIAPRCSSRRLPRRGRPSFACDQPIIPAQEAFPPPSPLLYHRTADGFEFFIRSALSMGQRSPRGRPVFLHHLGFDSQDPTLPLRPDERGEMAKGMCDAIDVPGKRVLGRYRGKRVNDKFHE